MVHSTQTCLAGRQVFVGWELYNYMKGAAHRNLKDIAVRCTFDYMINIFFTNIIATLSLPVAVI